MKAQTLIQMVLLPLAASLALLGCGSGNGATDGGADDGTSGQTCGAAKCLAGEQCINDAVCAIAPDKAAEACHETTAGSGIFLCGDPADLTCHNLAPCQQDTECPKDQTDVQLVCRQGFCGVPAPTASNPTVTFKGCVDAFGINQNTSGIRLAVYRADQDPTKTSTLDVEVTADAACTSAGAFSVDNVPTNLPLILKTYDPSGSRFKVTYKYNVVLWADLAADVGGQLTFDARGTALDPRTNQTISLLPWRGYAISVSTYSLILLTLGLNQLPEGHGAVAGTIRDCVYRELKGARCGFVERPAKPTYFNDAEDPRPQASQKATNNNGLYAGIDLPAGTHRVSCLAQNSSGENVPLGEYEFGVFADAITIVSFDWYPGAGN